MDTEKEALAPEPEVEVGGDEEQFVEDIPDETEGDSGPEGEADGPAEEGDQPDAQPGQPRDEQGRFSKPQQDAPGSISGSQPPPPADATSDATFRFNADGTEYQIEGSKMTPDGLLVPAAHVDTLKTLLAEGIAHRGSFQKKLAEKDAAVQAARRERTFEVERANKLYDLIIGKLQLPAEDVAEWLDTLADNLPKLQLDVERQALEAEKAQLRQGDEAKMREQQEAELRPRMEAALDSHLTQLTQHFPGVDPALVRDRFAGNIESAFFLADRDYPEAGVQKGEVALDIDVLVREFKFVQGLLQKVAPNTAAVTAIETKNKAALRKPNAPPAVGGTGTPATDATPGIPKFKSKAEAEKWIASGKWKNI